MENDSSLRASHAALNKISIRFFDDREVRAVWDDTQSKWWFSVVDIVGVLTQSKDPRKYWSVLKTRLKKTNPELTIKCSQLKLKANDGRENGGYGSHRDTEEMEAAGQARLAQRGNL